MIAFCIGLGPPTLLRDMNELIRKHNETELKKHDFLLCE